MNRDELPAISLTEFLLWLCRRRWRYRVSSQSMLPVLKPGDRVLVNPYAYKHTPPKPGDIVVARHPLENNLQIVKRVTATVEEQYILKGDNLAESTDSRVFGPVPPALILGQVVCRY